jgi:hypothetical protein
MRTRRWSTTQVVACAGRATRPRPRCQSLAALQALGSEQGGPTGLAYLAEVYLDRGQTEEGLGVLAEARVLLAPIYGWFTEGFDTADLQEAKGLLEELA